MKRGEALEQGVAIRRVERQERFKLALGSVSITEVEIALNEPDPHAQERRV
jgi:hypothetical protein